MQAQTSPRDAVTRRHRPKTLTVFAAAFAAGAVLAYGVDRIVDIHVVQVEPQVESEPIFVALRSLPQGSPVTVWDVALKDWPKAMLPTTALKADATFEGMVLRHPVREGQPLLSVQLVRDGAALPSAGLAATQPAAAPVRDSAAPSDAPAGRSNPAASEQFVPATPAETPVAATPTPVAVVAGPVTSPPQAAPAANSLVATPTDPDIDPTDRSAAAASVAQSEAGTGSTDVPAVEHVAVATDEVQEPAFVSATVPPPAEPTAAQPLVAPVPALPSTDIERSLAAVGRTNQVPAVATASVLDRTNRAPPPQTPAAGLRHHLVVPERVALAADSSFTQRPLPTAQPPVAPVQGMPPVAAATGTHRPNPTMPATARQPRMNPAIRKGAPHAKQPAATRQTMTRQTTPDNQSQSATKPKATRPAERGPGVTKPSATKAAEEESTRPLGLGAWFPQFSAGSRKR